MSVQAKISAPSSATAIRLSTGCSARPDASGSEPIIELLAKGSGIYSPGRIGIELQGHTCAASLPTTLGHHRISTHADGHMISQCEMIHTK